MVARACTALESLDAALASGAPLDFGAFLSGRTLSDAELAELIELDARALLRHNSPIPLERYLSAIPGGSALDAMPISLDAAIEFALRSLCGTSRPTEHAVEELVARHPALTPNIRNAAALSAGIATTRTLRGLSRPTPADRRTLPRPFGPPMADGRARYELQGRLGRGSQGEVYLAADLAMSEPDRPALVAIKVTASRAASSSERWRVIDEATRARRVNHENVVRVLDRGYSELGEDFIVYEHMECGNLDTLLHDRRLSPREAATLVARIARGVQAAHSAGLVHRDLKPSNVLLTSDGTPRVADFGCAAAIGHDAREVGTPSATADAGEGRIGNLAFIAPEQYRGDIGAQSAAVDVYALGGILAYILTGRLPHGSTTEEARRALDRPAELRAVELNASEPRAYDVDLASIVRRATQPDQSQRYATADALATDLEAWVRREPIAWMRPSPARRASLLVRRSPRQVILATLAAGVVIAAAALSANIWLRSRQRVEFAEIRRVTAQGFAEAEMQRQRALAVNLGQLQTSMVLNRDLEPTDWMPMVTILESLTGPHFFGTEGISKGLWHDRISATRRLIGRAESSGTPDGIEVLLWRDVLGYWLLRAGRPDEAIASLDAADAAWEARLAPGDPWRLVRAALSATATVHRTEQLRASIPGSLAGDPALLLAAETLRAADTYLENTQRGDSLHLLIAEALKRVYGLRLLDLRPERQSASKRLTALEAEARGERPAATNQRRGLPPVDPWDFCP